MARFSVVYGLSNNQADLDFVDVELTTDTPLFIDPYAIQIRHDEWSEKCGDTIRSFFNHLLDLLHDNRLDQAANLLNNLHEPNETRLGVSSGESSGRAIGRHKARQLTQAIINSRAFRTGQLRDVSEAELFIRGIGRDTMSDLTTNLIRGLLSDYTAEQCVLYDIPHQPIGSLGPVWNTAARRWESRTLMLPLHERKPILLVPKFSVRHRLGIDSQEFWNHHMLEFLRAEYIERGGSLVHFFKTGTRKGEAYVKKGDLKERHPFIKDDLAEFVHQHPDVLETYKDLVGAKGPLTTKEMQVLFDEKTFATALRRSLTSIPEGSTHASRYHSFAIGVCTFLFYPGLICPVKEYEVHEGRKRIDIKYTNSGETRFFQHVLQLPQTRSSAVLIECKNYTKEIANPELDQLAGRFGHQRGFFGMLLCRRMDDRARVIRRCRDTANDARGCMIVCEDADLDRLLGLIEQGNRSAVDTYLQDRFNEVVH